MRSPLVANTQCDRLFIGSLMGNAFSRFVVRTSSGHFNSFSSVSNHHGSLGRLCAVCASKTQLSPACTTFNSAPCPSNARCRETNIGDTDISIVGRSAEKRPSRISRSFARISIDLDPHEDDLVTTTDGVLRVGLHSKPPLTSAYGPLA